MKRASRSHHTPNVCHVSDGSYYSPRSHCGVGSIMLHSRNLIRTRASEAPVGSCTHFTVSGSSMNHQADGAHWRLLVRAVLFMVINA